MPPVIRPLSVTRWWQVDPVGGPALLALVPAPTPGPGPDVALDAEVAALSWLAQRDLGPRPVEPPSQSVLATLPALPAVDGLAPSTAAGTHWYDRTRWYRRLSGWPADGPENQVQGAGLLEGLGRALRRLHDLPVDASLPVVGLAELLDDAAVRVAAGAVDPEQFAPARRRLEPQRLLDQLRALEPVLERRRPVKAVVTHGSCRLGAVWLERTEPTGFIGAARLAVADPYRDLGAMARSLAAVFGAEGLPGFFSAYGLTDPDPIRLEFHALLDELL